MPTDEPRYRDAVIIGWSLLWRGTGSFLLLLFLANLAMMALLPELTRTGPSLWALLLPLGAVSALSALAVMPLVVRHLLRKAVRRLSSRIHPRPASGHIALAGTVTGRGASDETLRGSSEPRAHAVAREWVDRAAGRSR